MSQCDVILKAMLNNKEKEEWKASDFQKEPYFVGYEASARMSEIVDKYPDLIKVGKNGRYRTLSINWECENIENYLEMYKVYNETTIIGTLKDGLWKHIPRID